MKKQWIAPAFCACLGAGAAVLGITGGLILRAGVAKQEPDCDFLVVLGHRDRDGRIGATMDERIAKAAEYLKEHPHTLAILSGAQGEAGYMRQALMAAGICENRLILEEQSLSTWQNLKYSLPLAAKSKPERVAILSSDFHIFRTKMYLKDKKYPMIPVKTQDFHRWLCSYIREIAGVWHYILLGGTYD